MKNLVTLQRRVSSRISEGQTGLALVAREPHTAEKKQVLQEPAGKPALALAVGAIGPGRGDW